MLMIRLQRRGKLHQPAYRLVVGEKRSKLKGEQLEEIGWFNPVIDKAGFDQERIAYWLQKGAKLSPSAHNVLLKYKVIEGAKIAVHKQPKKTKEGAAAPAQS